MSTTFCAHPGSDLIPSFDQVCELASRNCQQFLRDIGFECQFPLEVQLRTAAGGRVGFTLNDAASWAEDQYALFSVPGVDGCTDVTFWRTYSVWEDSLAEEFAAKGLGDSWHGALQKAVQVGHYWSFRRSAGQPAVICLAYGMLAAAMAELTDGFIETTDAWDYDCFPAKAENFKSWYFRPEHTKDPDDQWWVSHQLAQLSTELKAAKLIG
jgi:hypothetical protein